MSAPAGKQDQKSSSRSPRRVAASVAARRAQEELAGLTQTPVERVVGVRRAESGWTVLVETLELRRTPPTMDVMALYEVQLSARGQVSGWDRVNRYHRSQVEGS
jgi:hypothetical protein